MESLLLIGSIVGLMIGVAMITRVFTDQKADFFLGIVVIMIAIELLFSWAAQISYTTSADAVPFWYLINYLVIPPSVWLFVKYNVDDNFSFQGKHTLLFVPAAIAYAIEFWSRQQGVSLMDYSLWVWFSEYLALAGLLFTVAYFWTAYIQLGKRNAFIHQQSTVMSKVKLVLLMTFLTLIALLWLIFSMIGWQYFVLVEYTLIIFFNAFAFIHFLEGRTFPALEYEEKNQEFPNYDDSKNLAAIDDFLMKEKPFLVPNYPLKELAASVQLPARYVSFLINHYHRKNYKEYINHYRIETFLVKARSDEKDYKTLLGLALESGFSSKSTFNQVFKTQLGQSPSEYLS